MLSAARIRDLIMLTTLVIWITYAAAAVIQLFTSGANVLNSLPPFWFWGIPLGPYAALYGAGQLIRPAPAPETPAAPQPPEAP